MSPLDYYVVRYSNQALYSFELIIALAAWVLVIGLWWRTGDQRPLWAYFIGGLYGTGVELLAQSSGIRTLPAVRLFGAVPVGFPALPLILGFFEGGVLLLAAFQIVRGVREHDRRALQVGAAIVLGLAAMIAVGSLEIRVRLATGAASAELTARALFSKGSLLTLFFCYALAIGYAARGGRAGGDDRRGLLLWYLTVALIAATWYTPAFLTSVREIAVDGDGAYVSAGLPEQIALLYGYSIVFEAAGFYLPVYVILRLCRLLRSDGKTLSQTLRKLSAAGPRAE